MLLSSSVTLSHHLKDEYALIINALPQFSSHLLGPSPPFSEFGHRLRSGRGFIGDAGVHVEEKNWLPFFPIIHHNIAKEIPIHAQRLQYLAFASWLGPTILFFQENAGHIAHRLEFVRLMMQRLQCNVFMLSYRGYGESDGYPSQHGIIKDAQAALDHLCKRDDIDTSRIAVFGRSLGGAVGSVLARNNPDKISALILENTFTSILDMAGVMLPFLKWFIGGSASGGPRLLNFLVRSPWSTIDVVSEIKQPILFLSGLQDELVPPFHMQMLYDKAHGRNDRCLFTDFPTGMHMDTWLSGGNRYWRTIQLFLDQYVSDTQEIKLLNKDDDNDKGNDPLL